MARISTVTFKGKSGNEYGFEVWPINQAFNNVGAIYAVTRRYKNAASAYVHDIIYIGETGDLEARFANHHKADCFEEHNANCICTHLDSDEDSRLTKEDDLVKKHNPICND